MNRQIYFADNWAIYNMSFCDLIRTFLSSYPEDFDILKSDEYIDYISINLIFNRFNLDIPLYYINKYLSLKEVHNSTILSSFTLWKLASYISIPEIYYYSNITSILLDRFANYLSMNRWIPLYFIRNRSEYKWNWDCISEYNTNFQEKDIYTNEFKQYNASSNQCILIEWILKTDLSSWNIRDICVRLTFKEIKNLLFNNIEGFPLDWDVITSCNPNITAEDILSHQEFPWHFYDFKNPTFEYYTIYPSNYIYSSNRMDLNDIHDKLGIPKPGTTAWNYLVLNRNLTLKEVYLFRKQFDGTNIYSNDYSCPKQKEYYKTLYSQIIQEIKY